MSERPKPHLTAAQVMAIFLSTDKPDALAFEYNVHRVTIRNIQHRKAWTELTRPLTAPTRPRRFK